MATSSAAAAADALHVLREIDPFALVLGNAVSLAEVASDVDVVVQMDPRRIAAGLCHEFRPSALNIVLAWRYDLGSWSLYLANGDLSRYAQLDLTFDPGGRGRYGFRSDRIRAGDGAEAGCVDPVDLQLYLLRKRALKGDMAAAESIAAELRDGLQMVDLVDRLGQLFRPSVARSLQLFVQQGRSRTWGLRADGSGVRSLERVPRILGRVDNRPGLWLHVLDRSLAEDLHQAVERVLRVSIVGTAPFHLSALRGGVTISSGVRTPRQADAVAGSTDLEGLVAEFVELSSAHTSLLLDRLGGVGP